ncbi:putative bifunctional diguanylate cyclase/phosphodiesterase [Falsiroseomonas sp. HW251]|uniref:putative bifunctional diguanylate cyclase/phosphodiesterase n=1 Tax=Falsiroseomonas sp. HW251 TaxID=3390998 RepID=UPI003D315A0A
MLATAVAGIAMLALDAWDVRAHRAAATLAVAPAPSDVRMAELGGGALLFLLLVVLAATATRRRAAAEAEAEAVQVAALRQSGQMAAAAAEERQRHRRELAAHASAFQATLDCMSLGLLTFGRHGRLTAANTRCAELPGVPLEALRPGATLPGLITASQEGGQAGAAELLQRLLPLVVRREATSFRHDLGDGRTALALHRPLPDGGWLATFEDVTVSRAAEQRQAALLEQHATTGLPNRASLRPRLAALLQIHRVSGGRVALLHINLSRFRAVNEALGHHIGDALLRAVAGRMSRLVRARSGADLLAHVGADEFVLVTVPAPSLRGDPAAEAAAIAERLALALARPFEVEGYRILTGAAIGIALFPASGETADELLRNAALATRLAKGAGQHGFFTPDLAIAAQAKRLLELDLRQALMEGAASAFEIHGEPIVEARSRRMAGVQASLRWRHAVHGLLPAQTLAPLAEELGLVLPLGRLALWRACTEAKGWPVELRLALRLSLPQLQDAGLVERVAATLAETGLSASRLDILLPLDELRELSSAALDAMHRLRDLGLRLTLDDVDAGADAPAALRAFPFDGARLSGLLVSELGGRNHGLEMMQALLALCGRHGTPIDAAGVETEEQFELLLKAGCRQLQGPLFGRARPCSDLVSQR